MELKKRYLQHIFDLRNKKHRSKEMQEDFDAYGEDYSLFLLEKVPCERTDEAEIPGNYSTGTICESKWMEKYNTIDPKYGYNKQDANSVKRIEKLRMLHTVKIPFVEGLPTPINE